MTIVTRQDKVKRADVLDVSFTLADKSEIVSYGLIAPQKGDAVNNLSVDIDGWLLGTKGPVRSAELLLNDKVIMRSPVNVPSPHLTEHFPSLQWGSAARFRFGLPMLGLPQRFTLTVQAVFPDQRRVKAITIVVHRDTTANKAASSINPLMLTGLGRSGTTWIMRLVSQHPRVISFEDYPYESNVSSYYLLMADAFLRTQALAINSHPEYNLADYAKWGGHPGMIRAIVGGFKGRLDGDIGDIATGIVSAGVDSFYRSYAATRNKNEPLYFMEKWCDTDKLWELYRGAKEIILVRDFRDVYCSIDSFNKKRGYLGFGREQKGSDVEFIKNLERNARGLLGTWKQRGSKAYMIRYEDVIMDPHGVLPGLLSYLGLESSPQIIDDMLQRASVDTNELSEHKTAKDPKASIGRWKKDLDPALIAQFNEIFRDVSREFGYDESGLMNAPVTPANPVTSAAPSVAESPSQAVNIRVELANATALKDKRNFMQAIETLERLYEQDGLRPEDRYEVLAGLLGCYMEQGMKEYVKLILDPLCGLALSLNKYAALKSLLNDYLAHFPSDASVLFAFATLLERGGEMDEAAETLENLLIFEPAHKEAKDKLNALRP